MNCELTKDTLEVLEHLSHANWFSRLGHPLDFHETNYVLADDLKSALVLMSKKVWNGILVETSNRLREELFPKITALKDSTRHPNYNDYIDHITEIITPIVRQKLKNADLSDKLLPTLNWVVMFIVFCFQFKEHIQEQFYFDMHKLIVNGRMPCGWIGKDYDHGQLVIL